MKIVRLKVYIIFSQSDDIALHAVKVTTVSSNLTKCQTCTVIAILYLGQYLTKSYGIQTLHDGRLVQGISAHARFDYIDLDARS